MVKDWSPTGEVVRCSLVLLRIVWRSVAALVTRVVAERVGQVDRVAFRLCQSVRLDFGHSRP